MAGNSKKSNNKHSKKSGCKVITPYDGGDGSLFINGWKVEKGVLWSITVNQAKKDGKYMPVSESNSGKMWMNVMVVAKAPLQENRYVYGLCNLENNKVYIKEWNWIMNPKGGKGGYCGKHISNDY